MTKHWCSPTLRQVLAVASITAAGALAACGSDGTETATATDGDVELSEVWTRPTAPGANSTAFYVTITNASGLDDQVVGAESPLCSTAELHMSSNVDGVMSMSPAGPDELQVTSSGQLTLEPGGLHIMCMGLQQPVADDDEVELTVRFEQAGPVTVQASVENR